MIFQSCRNTAVCVGLFILSSLQGSLALSADCPKFGDGPYLTLDSSEDLKIQVQPLETGIQFSIAHSAPPLGGIDLFDQGNVLQAFVGNQDFEVLRASKRPYCKDGSLYISTRYTNILFGLNVDAELEYSENVLEGGVRVILHYWNGLDVLGQIAKEFMPEMYLNLGDLLPGVPYELGAGSANSGVVAAEIETLQNSSSASAGRQTRHEAKKAKYSREAEAEMEDSEDGEESDSELSAAPAPVRSPERKTKKSLDAAARMKRNRESAARSRSELINEIEGLRLAAYERSGRPSLSQEGLTLKGRLKILREVRKYIQSLPNRPR